MSIWHVTIRAATQAEIDERNVSDKVNAIEGAAVVGTDEVPVLPDD